MPLTAIAAIVIVVISMAAVIVIAQDISQRGGPAVVAMTTHQATFYDYGFSCLGFGGRCVESFGSTLGTNQHYSQTRENIVMPEMAPPLILEKLGIECSWFNDYNNEGFFICYDAPLPIITPNNLGCEEGTTGSNLHPKSGTALTLFDTRYECDFKLTVNLVADWLVEYNVCNVEGITYDECLLDASYLVQHNPAAHDLTTLAILTTERLEVLKQSRLDGITTTNQPAQFFGFIDIDTIDFENVQPTAISEMYYAMIYFAFGGLGIVALLAGFVLIFEEFNYFPPGTATNILVKSFIALPLFPILPMVWDLLAINLYNTTLLSFNPLNTNGDPAYYATVVFQHASVLLPPDTFDQKLWLNATVSPEVFVRDFLFKLLMAFGQSLVLIFVMIDFFVIESARVQLQLISVAMLPFVYVLHMIPPLQSYTKIIFLTVVGLAISPMFVGVTFAFGGAMLAGASPDSDPFFMFITTITTIVIAGMFPVVFSPLLSVVSSKVSGFVQTAVMTTSIAGGNVAQSARTGSSIPALISGRGGPSSTPTSSGGSGPKTESDFDNASDNYRGNFDGGFVPGSGPSGSPHEPYAPVPGSPYASPHGDYLSSNFGGTHDNSSKQSNVAATMSDSEYSFVNNNVEYPSNIVHEGGGNSIDHHTLTHHMTELNSVGSESMQSTIAPNVLIQSQKMGDVLNSNPDSMQDFTQSYIDERNIQFANPQNLESFENEFQSQISQTLKSNPKFVSEIYTTNEPSIKI